MKLCRLSIGLTVTTFVLVFLVQAYAQTEITGCLKNGKMKKFQFGPAPSSPCKNNEQLVTFGLKEANDNLQANIDAEEAARIDADSVEAAARMAADGAEAAARIAADNALQASINTNTSDIRASETNIFANASNIGANASNIGANASGINTNASEIGTPFSNSRIDQNEADIADLGLAANGIVGVIETAGGGIEDSPHHYRTLVWDPLTGDLALRGELNHGLDPEVDGSLNSQNSYWWCTVGEQIADGDIQEILDNTADDAVALDAFVGYNQPLASWWRFQFLNNQGNGHSPFPKIMVKSDSGTYIEVHPTADYPVSGWLYGEKTAHLGSTGGVNGKTGRVFVGLSHRELRRLLIDSGIYTQFSGFPVLPTSSHDNQVIVDLNPAVTNMFD